MPSCGTPRSPNSKVTSVTLPEIRPTHRQAANTEPNQITSYIPLREKRIYLRLGSYPAYGGDCGASNVKPQSQYGEQGPFC